MTHSPARIVELLDTHGLRPSRALGQNFVADANTVRRIVRLAGVNRNDHVIEIGAGLGSLTLALVETGARVTAIEMDQRLLAVLRALVPSTVTIVEADATTLDWSTVLSPDLDQPAVVVANLPYNVGTSIVADLLDHVPRVERLVVLLQREVAQRLAAKPGSGAYGALSVKVRYHADASMIGSVPPTVFVPQPEVESALVEIRRRALPRVPVEQVDPERLFAVVRAGFAQRRKMLRRALDGIVSADAFVRAGVEPTARAEELDVEAWGRLAAL